MNTKIRVALLMAISIVAFECFFLEKKFRVYEPSRWRRDAAALTSVGNVRIGIVRGHHGAEFVRALPSQILPSVLRGPDGPEVQREMLLQLRAIPVKVAFEVAWYFVLFFGAVFLPIHLSTVRSKYIVPISAAALFVAALLLQLPLLFFNYDGSVFTTWHGPGAISWSRPPAHEVTGSLGAAVSYRFVLEALLSWPMRIAVPLVDSFADSAEVSIWVFTAAVAFFYAVLGAVAGLAIAASTRLRYRPAAHAV